MRCYNTCLPLIGTAAAALLMLQAPPPAIANTGAQPPVAAVAPITAPTIAAPSSATAATPADSVAKPPLEPPTEAAEAAKPKPKPLPPSLIARINLTSQTMTVQAAGKTIHTWKVSSGAPGYATPPGTFKPGWMARIWHSRQYDDAPMPHSVFFNDGIAVHATTSIGNLGRAASHGCVRLAPSNAEAFYNLVTRHGMARTRIVVHGNQPFSSTADKLARIERKHREAHRAAYGANPRPLASRGGTEWVMTSPRGQGGGRGVSSFGDTYRYTPPMPPARQAANRQPGSSPRR